MAKDKKMSKFMKKQEAIEKANAERERLKKEAMNLTASLGEWGKWAAVEMSGSILENDALENKLLEKPQNQVKSTSLVFFRQYNTYQALLEVMSDHNLSSDDIFSKTILYIMAWFRSRLGDEMFDEYPEISFLKEEYPNPDNFADFTIESANNINGLDFIELETAYIPDKAAWLFCLTEPDNGNDKKDIQGRTFTTEIMVYKLEKSAVLGIRESCREPRTNTVDANVYRPAFIRSMFKDPDLILGEYGLKREYAFDSKPVLVNGKSGEACENLMKELIASDCRQMPILFVPEKVFQTQEEEVDDKTESLLGFAHVVVWQGSCRKLFAQVMENEEFAEVGSEGQIILYRTNYLQEYPSEYFEFADAAILGQIRNKIKKEPIRKICDFKEFAFKPSWWEFSKNSGIKEDSSDSVSKEAYENEISRLNLRIRDLERDNSALQGSVDSLNSEIEKLDKDRWDLVFEESKLDGQIQSLEEKNKELKEELRDRKLETKRIKEEFKEFKGSEKQRYEPIIDQPFSEKDIKEGILSWIEKYYSDVLVVHPNAVKSLEGEKRNIDWHKLCMMIHYLAGYTRYRNAGGVKLNKEAARDYDPEEFGFTVEPSSSGKQGATEVHKEKYTIRIEENGKMENETLDLHIKCGKGMDIDMIRVYFYYSPELQKSVIGYMPGHLPTRKDSH